MALMVAVLPWGGNLAFGNAGPAGVTWYANSPSGISPATGSDTGTALRKFVDSLPGLSADGGVTGANNLGQYIPIAKPIANPDFPDSDYYEIGIMNYTKKVHTDLPKATKFRGYVDLGTGAAPVPQYLGPVIVAQRDRPVRIKFTNQLGTGTAGNLFLPVDTTLMGAGLGPLGWREVITPRTAPPSITMGPLRPGSVMGRRTNGLPPPEKGATTSRA